MAQTQFPSVCYIVNYIFDLVPRVLVCVWVHFLRLIFKFCCVDFASSVFEVVKCDNFLSFSRCLCFPAYFFTHNFKIVCTFVHSTHTYVYDVLFEVHNYMATDWKWMQIIAKQQSIKSIAINYIPLRVFAHIWPAPLFLCRRLSRVVLREEQGRSLRLCVRNTLCDCKLQQCFMHVRRIHFEFKLSDLIRK